MGLLVDPADPRRLELAATFLEKGRQVLIELTHPTSGRSGWPIGHHDSLMTGSHLSASFFALKDLKRESAFCLAQLFAGATRRALLAPFLGPAPLSTNLRLSSGRQNSPHPPTPTSPDTRASLSNSTDLGGGGSTWLIARQHASSGKLTHARAC